MKPKTYILQKDIFFAKAGDEFIETGTNSMSYLHKQTWCQLSVDVIENNPELFKLKGENPPLGLIPLYLHNYNRLNDIKVAIVRYKEVGKDVPQEWLFEENDLETKLGLDYNENQARIRKRNMECNG